MNGCLSIVHPLAIDKFVEAPLIAVNCSNLYCVCKLNAIALRLHKRLGGYYMVYDDFCWFSNIYTLRCLGSKRIRHPKVS
jgi:hypothetical protein